MILTDTHTHLYLEDFDSDRDALMQQALAQDIQRFFLPNIDTTSVDSLLSLTQKYPANCFAMMGLHPCSVKENYAEELSKINETLNLKRESIYAVGEIGMDLYWDKTFVKEQEITFITQCHWADEMNLPIVIHSRNSTDELIAIIKNQDHLQLKGIFHCFSGNLQQAKEVIDLGFYLGIGGVVTFKNSGLDKVVEQIDLKHLVLETDAPYLAPAPHRGKRNIPEYLKLVAEKIAAIKNITLEDVASVTTENSKKIFGV
ncbi:MAG: TatD family hydrolase [Bacteroidia bacterium]